MILAAVDLVKQRNPEAMYCCDPVIGDVGRGVFVRPGIPELMRDHGGPARQTVTPNHFELDFLTGTEPDTLESTIRSRSSWPGRWGPPASWSPAWSRPDRPEDTIEMLAVTPEGA